MIYLVADCQGVFIAIDGIGRSGKITQQRIVYSLNNEGFYAKYTMEPINGLLGNFIKNKILKKMSPDIEALLFVADI